MEHESDVYTNYDWCSWYSHRRIDKETGGHGNKRMSGDLPNYYTIEIGQNTEKSPGDLRRFTVILTSEKDNHLSLMCKTLNWLIFNRWKFDYNIAATKRCANKWVPTTRLNLFLRKTIDLQIIYIYIYI